MININFYCAAVVGEWAIPKLVKALISDAHN